VQFESTNLPVRVWLRDYVGRKAIYSKKDLAPFLQQMHNQGHKVYLIGGEFEREIAGNDPSKTMLPWHDFNRTFYKTAEDMINDHNGIHR
jgi:hypothetical protein